MSAQLLAMLTDLSELEAPLIDTVLKPGQMLYVPAGFPHTTDTVTGEAIDSTEPSLHMTLGVDTHIWYLNYASLRTLALKRSRLPDKLQITKLAPPQYWDMQSALPFGFLNDAHSTRQAMPSHEKLQAVVQSAVIKFRAAEPNRWAADVTDEQIAESMDLITVVTKLAEHHLTMVDIFKAMYTDVAFKVSLSPISYHTLTYA